MKTPMPDVDAFVEALRGDLPSADDEARVRARLLAATVVATSAALTSTSAGASLGSAGASAGGVTASGAPAAVALVGGASAGAAGVAGGTAAGVAGGAGVASGTAAVSGTAAAGAGALGAAAPAAAKVGLLAKLLVLPLGAKVGAVASVAVAVAATSVPLVMHQTRDSSAEASNASEIAAVSSPGTRPFDATKRRAEPTRDEPAPEEAARDGAAFTEPQPSQVPARPALVGEASSSPAVPSDAQRERGDVARRRAIPPRRSGSSSTTPAKTTRAAPSAAQTAPARMSALGEETRLMERAMLALGQGDAQLARRFLDEHARRFPRGLLAPERERAQERARALGDRAGNEPTF